MFKSNFFIIFYLFSFIILIMFLTKRGNDQVNYDLIHIQFKDTVINTGYFPLNNKGICLFIDTSWYFILDNGVEDNVQIGDFVIKELNSPYIIIKKSNGRNFKFKVDNFRLLKDKNKTKLIKKILR